MPQMKDCVEWIGGSLMLQENFNQEKYATHDLQLFTIVHALKFWRHLVGRKFESKVDHDGLQHIFTQSTLNARQR